MPATTINLNTDRVVNALTSDLCEALMSSGEDVTRVVIRVESDQLTKDDAGGLVEDPPLLELTQKVTSRFIAAYKNRVFGGFIVCIEGAYLINIDFDNRQTDAFDGSDQSKAIVKTLAEHTRLVGDNSLKNSPEGASELGIDKRSFTLLEAVAEIAENSKRVTIQSDDGEVALPAPSVDAIKALPKPPIAPRRVDGRVTAIGLGDDNSARIEVNKAEMLLVPDLSLEEAFKHLKSASHVTGVHVVSDGKHCLEDANFYDPGWQQGLSLPVTV